MLIKTTDFRVNANKQEILPMKQQGFQYACLVTEPDNFKEGIYPWHWHSAFEIDYMDKGTIDFHTTEGTIRLFQGDAIFVNSGVLHSYHICDREDFRIHAHLFDTAFLSGQHNDCIDNKYIMPILKCGGLNCFKISSDNPNGIKMLSELVNITELMNKELYGYEFDVRHRLSLFWRILLEETEVIRKSAKTRRNSDGERMKLMIGFIQDKFMDNLTLDEIAASANISRRECIRCFQRSIDDTPINYLNNYRIRMAAQMLAGTSDSVTYICERCGFSSPSYFGKVFREAMGVTPLKYRNNQGD